MKPIQKMIYNINTMCEVTLTEAGAVALNKYRIQYFKNLKHKSKKGDIFRTELWNLMNIFGKKMYNGRPKSLFQNNNIKIEKGIK